MTGGKQVFSVEWQSDDDGQSVHGVHYTTVDIRSLVFDWIIQNLILLKARSILNQQTDHTNSSQEEILCMRWEDTKDQLKQLTNVNLFFVLCTVHVPQNWATFIFAISLVSGDPFSQHFTVTNQQCSAPIYGIKSVISPNCVAVLPDEILCSKYQQIS